MLRKIWPSLSYANVASTIALVAALGTGSAYAANTVFSTDIVDGEVKHADIAGNSITSTNIYPGSVTKTDIHTDAVDSTKVLADSLSLSDILGANVSGSISFSLGANACGNLSIGVSGAQVGQIVVFSFTGSTAVPTTVVFGGVKVTAADTVVVRACNVGASAMSVSDLGIHIATFG